MESKIEWLILVTDKYQESLRFYQDVLGFKIERETAEEEFCQFSLGNCYLAIYGRKQVENLVGVKFNSAPCAIYTFPESENVDVDYEELKNKGIKFIKPPETQSWGQRTAYFSDPDGNVWEIQQWINK